MKKKLIFKEQYYKIIKELTDKQAGEFIKGICAYVYEGKPFITKDEYLKGLFMYVKRELDVSEMNSINGKKGAEKRLEIKRRNQVVGVIIESVMVSGPVKKDESAGV